MFLQKPDWADYTTSSSVSVLDHSSSSGGGAVAYDSPSAHHAPSSLGGGGSSHQPYHETSFEQLHLHQQAQQAAAAAAAAAAARNAYGDDPFGEMTDYFIKIENERKVTHFLLAFCMSSHFGIDKYNLIAATNGPRSGPLFARGANAVTRSAATQLKPTLQQQPSGLDSIFNNVSAT